MKAYALSLADDPDAGNAIVFANTVKEAKKQVFSTDMADAYGSSDAGWIQLRAHRYKRYDDLEKLSTAELACKQWRDGWQWFDIYDVPDPDEATDAEFIEWYERTFNHDR